MTNRVVFIKENSPEVRKKLEDVGYSVCICASFEDSIWLNYYPNGKFPYDIHGTGFTDETDSKKVQAMSPIERIQYWLNEEGFYSPDREFFDTVKEFLKKYPKVVSDQPIQSLG